MEKINYQKELDILLNSIKDIGKRPRLLLHSCCGPCSSYCLQYLKDYFEITVLYYNPNIYPEEEYDLRLNEQKKIIKCLNREYGINIDLITLLYDHSEFSSETLGYENEKEGGIRCKKCYEFRLKKTAQLAEKGGYDYFGTTLTVSPHKNAMILNSVGNEAMININNKVLWLPSDFKKKDGYKRSIELSKKYELYRQDYCGCEFSIYHDK